VDGVPVEGATCGWCRRELHVRRECPQCGADLRSMNLIHSKILGAGRRLLQLDLRDGCQRVPAAAAAAVRGERKGAAPSVRGLPGGKGVAWRSGPVGAQHPLHGRGRRSAAADRDVLGRRGAHVRGWHSAGLQQRQDGEEQRLLRWRASCLRRRV
jgi:hypothetical protein